MGELADDDVDRSETYDRCDKCGNYTDECDCPKEQAMSEQLNHRAAIGRAVAFVEQYGEHLSEGCVNDARCYLASVKAAWPGVVPVSVSRYQGRWWYEVGTKDAPNEDGCQWTRAAIKFERDYPGLKVDDEWLTKVMENTP